MFIDKLKTIGIIKRTIYKDSGNITYVVDVELNGEVVKAQSINYSSKTKKFTSREMC